MLWEHTFPLVTTRLWSHPRSPHPTFTYFRATACGHATYSGKKTGHIVRQVGGGSAARLSLGGERGWGTSGAWTHLCPPLAHHLTLRDATWSASVTSKPPSPTTTARGCGSTTRHIYFYAVWVVQPRSIRYIASGERWYLHPTPPTHNFPSL